MNLFEQALACPDLEKAVAPIAKALGLDMAYFADEHSADFWRKAGARSRAHGLKAWLCTAANFAASDLAKSAPRHR